MRKRMKLKGQVRQELAGRYVFSSKMHDGTPFTVTVDQHDVELNDNLSEDRQVVDGWLLVAQEAKQDTRCYLTLPKPTIQHGHQVIVHELQLMTPGLTLASFGPKVTGGKKSSTKPTVEAEVEILSADEPADVLMEAEEGLDVMLDDSPVEDQVDVLTSDEVVQEEQVDVYVKPRGKSKKPGFQR